MNKSVHDIGLDVHKESSAISIASVFHPWPKETQLRLLLTVAGIRNYLRWLRSSSFSSATLRFSSSISAVFAASCSSSFWFNP